MAIEIKSLVCPQCASSDIRMESETQGVCQACGARFTVQQQSNPQNVYNEVHVHLKSKKPAKKESCDKLEIVPEYTKEEFIRKAWIQLAKEEAPLEVFSGDFDSVTQKKHQVVIDTVTVDVKYQGSAGYHRQEPYLDYETYYEKEPYLTTESYYDSTTRTTRTRQVTKYQTVEKHRPVTRYQTVVDWSPTSGHQRAESTVFAENLPHVSFDEGTFYASYKDLQESSLKPVSDEVAQTMVVTEKTRKIIEDEHADEIFWSVERSLPGDDHQRLDWEIAKEISSSTRIVNLVEYRTSITYNGVKYKRYAFPFGSMVVEGDPIEDKSRPVSVTEKIKSDFFSMSTSKERKTDRMVDGVSVGIVLLTILLLIGSILVSCFVRVREAVVGCFIAAVVAFFSGILIDFVFDKVAHRITKSFINAEMKRAMSEISDYSEDYEKKVWEALNLKLESLGLRPATDAEMKEDEEEKDEKEEEDEDDEEEEDEDE